MDNEQFAAYKNFGKKLTWISLVLVAVGIVLKIKSIPYGNPLFVCGMATLALISFFILPKTPFPESDGDKPSGNRLRPFWTFSVKLLGWSISVLLLGILLRVEHWPGWNVFLIIGVPSVLLAVALFLDCRRQLRKEL